MGFSAPSVIFKAIANILGQRTILGRNAIALFVPGRQQSKKADGNEKAKKNVIVA